MSELRYRALRILLGFLSLLMAVGGMVLVFSSKGAGPACVSASAGI